MNILLIAPSSGKWRHVGRARLFNGKIFRFSLLSLLSVAAETPAGHGIRIVDEQFDSIPGDGPVDLAGITCMTALAPRAYEIADAFRARGVPVVLGGMHPTFCPEEALSHADAVVAGEAEGIWPRVVEDARNGRLHGIYRAEKPSELAGLRRPPAHLLKKGRYSTWAVQATRGCPHQCAFCAVSAFHRHQHRRRPVDEVTREAAAIPARFFIFVDDNLTADRDYARALFSRLAPLNKRWITQSSLEIADDENFVQAAAEAGCVGVFVGLETFSEANLSGVQKTCNRIPEYRDKIRMLHRHGIGVEAGVVFGFDQDDPSVFARALGQLDELEIDMVQISIFTPLPGTRQYEITRGRITDRDWAHYDFHHVVFEPLRMSAEALQAGHDWVTREFYRPWRIVRRLARIVQRPRGWSVLPYAAAINLAYYGRIRRWGIQGWDPGRETERTGEILPWNAGPLPGGKGCWSESGWSSWSRWT
ncbi:MAG: radical SAM protein [bacterium]